MLETGLQKVISDFKSCVFDVSTLTTLQFQEVADKFCWLLFCQQARIPKDERRNCFIIFEEAQIVMPQGVLNSKRLQNISKVLTVGRNFKIRMGAITQFAASVDKGVVKYAKQRYFGWTDEMNDRKYISKFIGEEAETLANLQTLEFIYYFPTEKILQPIKVQPRW